MNNNHFTFWLLIRDFHIYNHQGFCGGDSYLTRTKPGFSSASLAMRIVGLIQGAPWW